MKYIKTTKVVTKTANLTTKIPVIYPTLTRKTKTKPVSSGPYGLFSSELVIPREVTSEELLERLNSPIRFRPKATRKAETVERAESAPATEQEINAVRHMITNLVEVPSSQKRAFTANLKQLTARLTAFLVTEVSAYQSALDNALDDAAESIKLLSGVEDVEFTFGKANAVITQRIPELMTLRFLLKELKVPPSFAKMIFAEYQRVISTNGTPQQTNSGRPVEERSIRREQPQRASKQKERRVRL